MLINETLLSQKGTFMQTPVARPPYQNLCLLQNLGKNTHNIINLFNLLKLDFNGLTL